MSGYFGAAPRALAPGDQEAVRALVLSALGVTPYVDRTLELVATAAQGDPETRAMLVEGDGIVAALALYGPVSGARDAWILSTLLIAAGIATPDVARGLLDAVLATVRAGGGRFLLAEMPADPVIGTSLTLLRKSGFRQEARIPDFYRDGVALLFLRRTL